MITNVLFSGGGWAKYASCALIFSGIALRFSNLFTYFNHYGVYSLSLPYYLSDLLFWAAVIVAVYALFEKAQMLPLAAVLLYGSKTAASLGTLSYGYINVIVGLVYLSLVILFCVYQTKQIKIGKGGRQSKIFIIILFSLHVAEEIYSLFAGGRFFLAEGHFSVCLDWFFLIALGIIVHIFEQPTSIKVCEIKTERNLIIKFTGKSIVSIIIFSIVIFYPLIISMSNLSLGFQKTLSGAFMNDMSFAASFFAVVLEISAFVLLLVFSIKSSKLLWIPPLIMLLSADTSLSVNGSSRLIFGFVGFCSAGMFIASLISFILPKANKGVVPLCIIQLISSVLGFIYFVFQKDKSRNDYYIVLYSAAFIVYAIVFLNCAFSLYGTPKIKNAEDDYWKDEVEETDWEIVRRLVGR